MATELTEVTFAYHVTNVQMLMDQTHSEESDELAMVTKQMEKLEVKTDKYMKQEEIEEKWKELKMTQTAINPDYDSPMESLIKVGVSMSTTLWQNDLPTITPYPKGGENGNNYWRVKVPLNRFSNYRIILCKCTQTKQLVEQVSILLVDPSDEPLNKKVAEKITGKQVTELTGQRNEYLFQDQTTQKWYTNNYSKANKVWVNIVIPHSVALGDDCKWDTVERYEPDNRNTTEIP